MEEQKVKLLIYDIEVTGHLGYSYGIWDTNIHKVIEYPILLSFSYMWYEEGKKPRIINKGLIDYPNYKKNHKDDSAITKDLWAVINEADITLGHNSIQFDDKMANMFFLKHNLRPPAPHKAIDTKRAAKAIGRFGSNSLNSLGDFFGIGQKTKETHADLWWDCLLGDTKAWSKMKKYNQQDVMLTMKLYERLRPYIMNHPNMARLSNRPHTCPNCMGDSIQQRGKRTTNTSVYFRYRCNGCGHWMTGRQAFRKDEDIKPAYANYTN